MNRDRDRRDRSGRSRAQTTLDFGIGVGVFVVAVAFVFAFAPGMIEPFEASTQEETASINRVADRVVQDLLAEPGEPYALQPWCTVAFLSTEDDDYDTDLNSLSQYPSEAANCRWEEGTSLDERLGLSESKLNVRVRLVTDFVSADLDDPDAVSPTNDNQQDTVCYDYNSDRFVEAGDPFESGTECDLTSGDADRLLAVGPTPPESDSSVVTARRTVRVPDVLEDGTDDGLMVVEVWR